MRTRITRNSGGKTLGFASTAHIQNRNYGMFYVDNTTLAAGGALLVAGVTLPPLAIYYTCRFFRNNYEIVRKDKKDNMNAKLNEKNGSEDPQSMRGPGKIVSNHD